MSHLSSTAMDDSSPLGLVDLSFPAIQATEQHSDNSNTIPDDLVSDLPKKGLTICPLNIRHRSNKLDEIKLLLTSVASRRHGKPNLILGISESFLDSYSAHQVGESIALQNNCLRRRQTDILYVGESSLDVGEQGEGETTGYLS